MIEKFLINSGCKCGTKKNFSTVISDDLRIDDFQHWYFLTPLKVIGKQNGVMSTTINMAYPFIAEDGETTEEDVLKRISDEADDYKNGLKEFFNKWSISNDIEFSEIPFYGGSNAERTNLTTFGNNKIHLLNVIVKVSYRENKIN